MQFPRADLIGIVAAPGEAFTAHFNSAHYAVQFFSSNGVEAPPGQPVDGAFAGRDPRINRVSAIMAKRWPRHSSLTGVDEAPPD